MMVVVTDVGGCGGWIVCEARSSRSALSLAQTFIIPITVATVTIAPNMLAISPANPPMRWNAFANPVLIPVADATTLGMGWR